MIIFQSLWNQRMRRPSPPNMWDLFLNAWLWNFKATSLSSPSPLDLIHGLKCPKGDENLRWRKAMLVYTIFEEGKTHILCVFVSLIYLGSSIKNEICERMKRSEQKLRKFWKEWILKEEKRKERVLEIVEKNIEKDLYELWILYLLHQIKPNIFGEEFLS